MERNSHKANGLDPQIIDGEVDVGGGELGPERAIRNLGSASSQSRERRDETDLGRGISSTRAISRGMTTSTASL